MKLLPSCIAAVLCCAVVNVQAGDWPQFRHDAGIIFKGSGFYQTDYRSDS